MHYNTCNYNLSLYHPQSDFHSCQVQTCVLTTASCSAPTSAAPTSTRYLCNLMWHSELQTLNEACIVRSVNLQIFVTWDHEPMKPWNYETMISWDFQIFKPLDLKTLWLSNRRLGLWTWIPSNLQTFGLADHVTLRP